MMSSTRATFSISIFDIFAFTPKRGKRFERGFTLIELLMVIGIVGMLAGMTLSSITRSRTQNAVRQGSQFVAQALRDAESHALAVKVYGSVYPAYGVHFMTPKNNALNYQPFVDLDGDGTYSAGDVADGVKLTLPRGAMVKKIMYWDEDGSLNTTTDDDFAVVFTRPEPTISFSSSAPRIGSSAYAGVCIGAIDTAMTRLVKVWRTGHVSVGDSSTDCNE